MKLLTTFLYVLYQFSVFTEGEEARRDEIIKKASRLFALTKTNIPTFKHLQ